MWVGDEGSEPQQLWTNDEKIVRYLATWVTEHDVGVYFITPTYLWRPLKVDFNIHAGMTKPVVKSALPIQKSIFRGLLVNAEAEPRAKTCRHSPVRATG